MKHVRVYLFMLTERKGAGSVRFSGVLPGLTIKEY